MTSPPAALEHLAGNPIWVGFKITYTDGAQRKIPIDPRTGKAADIDNPATWGTWAEVQALLDVNRASFHAIAIHDELNQTWLDFDHVIVDGEMVADALAIGQRFETYAELSLSGEGVHVAMLGRKPEGAGAKKKLGTNGSTIELYDRARFMIVTGNELPSSTGDLRDCSAALAKLCEELFPADIPDDKTRPDESIVKRLAGRFPEIKGSRHEAALALSGALLRCDWPTDRIKALLMALADSVFADENNRKIRKREWVRGVDDTARALANHGKVYGWPKLVTLLGRDDTEAIRALVEKPKQEPEVDRSPFAITAADAFNTTAPAARTFVVQDMIPAGEVALLVGSGGTGKSMFAVQMAMCVALGVPVLGRLPVQRSGEVLYISAEDRMDELHRRVYACWQLLNLYNDAVPDPATIARLKMTSVSGDDVSIITSAYGEITRTHVVEKIAATVESMSDPVLIVLDPVSRFYAANENDNAERTAFVAAIEHLSLRTETAVLMVAHASKQAGRDGEISQDAARGGSAMVDGVRSVFNLTTARDSDVKEFGIAEKDRRLYLRLDHTKSNYALPLETIWMRRAEAGALEGVEMKPEKEKDAERVLADRCSTILAFIESRTDRQSIRMIRDLWCGVDGPLKMSDKTFRRALSEGVDRGWLALEKVRGQSGFTIDFIVPGSVRIPEYEN